MTERWHRFPVPEDSPLNAQLAGRAVSFGNPELGQDDRTITIYRAGFVTVGLDVSGLFASVTVMDTDGGAWEFFTDGEVCDAEGDPVGRCALVSAVAV